MVHPRLTSPGGAENVVVWLSAELADRGHTVTIISLESNPGLWSDLNTEKVRFIELGKEARYAIGFMGRRLVPHLEGTDIVCAHNTPAHWWAANAVNRPEKNIPLIWFCHEPHRITYFSITDEISAEHVRNGSIGSLPNHEAFSRRVKKRIRHERVFKSKWRRRQDAAALKTVSMILANSGFTADNLRRAMGGNPVVCQPGIPAANGENSPLSARDGIVFLSNFVPSKNVFGLLGAMDRIVNQEGRKDIQFHFLGDGHSPDIQEFLESKGLESFAEFHGFVSEADKMELLNSVRLCVFIPFCEPFGLVTLEAFRSGTPVVVSDHGGPAEVIGDSGLGIKVNPYDTESIANGILEVYDDLERLETMSREGRELVQNRYEITHFADRFEQNLKSWVSG